MEKLGADNRFAIVPEWVIALDISHTAFRLYAVLARYADNITHQAFPARATLAQRLQCSEKTVDRAVEDLVAHGAIHKQSRGRYASALYTVMTAAPGETKMSTEQTEMSSEQTDLSFRSDKNDHLTRTTELEPDNYIEKKSKKATSIPDPFALSDSLREAMMGRHPSLDLDEQVDAFVDFHTAKGSVFKSWDAAFRTWCRNAVKFAEPRTVIHKQALKPAAEGPTQRAWVLKMHDMGEHWECRPGEFGCR
jgi:DNA-binding transcriptional regulator YhcF (GntR family)